MRRRFFLALGVVLLLVAAVLAIEPELRLRRPQRSDDPRTYGCADDCCADPAHPTCASYAYSPAYAEDIDAIRTRALAAAAVRPGDHVADLGAGYGWATDRLLGLVGPTGEVWATDIDPRAHAHLAAMPGVHAVLVKAPRDTGLDAVPDGSLAAALMLHSITFSRSGDRAADLAWLRALRRKLASGARVVYTDDQLDGASFRRDDVVTLFAEAGFSREATDVPMPARLPERTCYCGSPRGPTVADKGFLVVLRVP